MPSNPGTLGGIILLDISEKFFRNLAAAGTENAYWTTAAAGRTTNSVSVQLKYSLCGLDQANSLPYETNTLLRPYIGPINIYFYTFLFADFLSE